MFRVTQGFRPSAVTMLGGLFMASGALVYLHDSMPKPRNLHTFLFPALGLMALGAVIAFLGAVFIDRRGVR
jgi:hypothetical protein